MELGIHSPYCRLINLGRGPVSEERATKKRARWRLTEASADLLPSFLLRQPSGFPTDNQSDECLQEGRQSRSGLLSRTGAPKARPGTSIGRAQDPPGRKKIRLLRMGTAREVTRPKTILSGSLVSPDPPVRWVRLRGRTPIRATRDLLSAKLLDRRASEKQRARHRGGRGPGSDPPHSSVSLGDLPNFFGPGLEDLGTGRVLL